MSAIASAASSVGGWFADVWKSHWKIITAVAVGAVVAMAVTAAILGTWGTATPILFAAAGASGASSAGVTQAVDDLLEHKSPGLDVAEATVIGGAASVATMGAGRALMPYVPEWVATYLPGQAIEPLENGGQVVETAVWKNIPWGSIPRVVFNQTWGQLAQDAEIGIVGALGGTQGTQVHIHLHDAAPPGAHVPQRVAPPATIQLGALPAGLDLPGPASRPLPGALGD